MFMFLLIPFICLVRQHCLKQKRTQTGHDRPWEGHDMRVLFLRRDSTLPPNVLLDSSSECLTEFRTVGEYEKAISCYQEAIDGMRVRWRVDPRARWVARQAACWAQKGSQDVGRLLQDGKSTTGGTFPTFPNAFGRATAILTMTSCWKYWSDWDQWLKSLNFGPSHWAPHIGTTFNTAPRSTLRCCRLLTSVRSTEVCWEDSCRRNDKKVHVSRCFLPNWRAYGHTGQLKGSNNLQELGCTLFVNTQHTGRLW